MLGRVERSKLFTLSILSAGIFATKSAGKWIYKGGEIEKDFTDHTQMIYFLLEIGKKMKYEVFIGKREQSEIYNGKKLSKYADIINLDKLNLEKEKKDRVEMIDMVWISNNKVEYAIEVENSTNFTSGIQRASNLDISISKIMVLPNKRKNEFLRIKDPLFVDSFKKYNWGYLYYDDILSLKNIKKIDKETIDKLLNHF